ncbi:MAG: FAD-dependent oxidoreductase, partial [Bacteriovoracia bacterium]
KLGKVRFHPASEVSAVEVLGSGVMVRLSTEASVQVDRLVLALGFDAPKSFLSGLNIQMSCEAGDVFCESDHRGVYFIGDLAQKRGGSINLAFNSAFRALESACATELNCELD